MCRPLNSGIRFLGPGLIGSMSEWIISNKRLRIDHLIHMPDEAAPPPALDDLMDSACDRLDLCRDRGIDIGPEARMIEIAIAERNSARLEKLIARVEAKLQKFNATSVGASSAPPVSAAIERQIESDTSSVAESQNRIQTHNADIASLATLPAILEYHGPPKTKRGRRPRILVTTAGDPVSVSSSHSYSSTSKHEAF